MYQWNCLHASKSTQRKPPVLTGHTLKRPAGETEYQGLMSYVGKQSVLPESSRTLGYPDPVGLPLPQWSAPGLPCSPCPSSSGWRWPDLLPTDRKQVSVLWQRQRKQMSHALMLTSIWTTRTFDFSQFIQGWQTPLYNILIHIYMQILRKGTT